MKLLLENNLSVRVVDDLQNAFPGTSYLYLQNIQDLTDRGIWDYSAAHDYEILTKDKNFYHLANAMSPPQKLFGLQQETSGTMAYALLYCPVSMR